MREYDRDRRRRREELYGKKEREDGAEVIIQVLSMQILLCLIIVAAIYLLKMMGLPFFETIRTECDAILNRAELLNLQEFRSLFSSAASVVNSWLGGSPDAAPVAALGFSGMGGMLRVDSALAPPAGTSAAPIVLTARPKMPVDGVVTSRFGFRVHPITGKSDFHTGIDIAAPEGAPIGAALPGTVLDVGESNIYGRYIQIQHSDNLVTTYNHCSTINTRVGVVVRQGERIALVGSTGMVTGPHLHFEIRVGGLCSNPAWVMDYETQD